jgi:hypothetical protein
MNISHAKEIIECHNSFVHFCENYILIPNTTKGLEKYSLHEYQKNLITDYENHRHVILRKYRNGGFATTTMAWLMWKLLFQFDQRIIWMEPREVDARFAAKTFKLIMAMLPDWMYPELRNKNSIYQLDFSETGGSICFRGPAACRGRGASHVVINDAAFIRDMDNHWKAIWPVLACGGQSIVMSTAADSRRAFEWYECTFRAATKGENNFHIHETHYKDCPYWQDEKFCQAVREALGEEGWQQEVLGNVLLKPKE